MTYATETMPPALVGQVQRRVGPPRRLRVSFACNDPENPGRVWAAQPESLYRVGKHPWDAELTHDDWGRGVAFTVDAPRMRLRLHRQWFAYKRCIPYFGNMMWDAFEFERGTGARLLDAMRRDGGWHCEAGPSSFYRWWNRRPNPSPCEIRAAREAAGLTQAQAAGLVHASLRNWQQWEQSEGPSMRRMHPGLWELFRLKTGA